MRNAFRHHFMGLVSLSLSLVYSLGAFVASAIWLIPSGIFGLVYETFQSAMRLFETSRAALTVGTRQFFKPKIQAFVASVHQLTPDRYAIRNV